MDRRFQTGTVVSAVGHVGIVLWVLVGDWLFAADRPPETMTITATTISSDQFAELQAATANPSEEPAPVRPQARPDEVVPEEPVPEEPPPEEVTPPEPVVVEPPAEEVPPDPAPEPPANDLPQAETEQVIESDSTEIQPTPEAEDIIAPDPVTPETEAEISDTPEPAASDQPTEEPVIVDEPTAETVLEDTGDVTQTEANQDDTAETGMQASPRPRTRPERTPEPPPETEVAEDPPAEEPAESAELTVQPVDDTETQDAIDALLGEASEEPVEEAVETGGQDLPQGPPLTGGEMGDISSAIGRRWNLGASSTDALSTVVVLRVTFDETGRPIDFQVLDADGPTQAGIDNIVRTAKSAVTRAYTQDGGLPLPPDKYATWRVLDLVFDAKGMRAR
jgi:hypothetical protein